MKNQYDRRCPLWTTNGDIQHFYHIHTTQLQVEHTVTRRNHRNWLGNITDWDVPARSSRMFYVYWLPFPEILIYILMAVTLKCCQIKSSTVLPMITSSFNRCAHKLLFWLIVAFQMCIESVFFLIVACNFIDVHRITYFCWC